MAAVEFIELADGIAGVTLNRPDLLNAIDGALLDGIDEALDKLSAWNYRVAVLTGAGRGFCAGADMDLLQSITDGDREGATSTETPF